MVLRTLGRSFLALSLLAAPLLAQQTPDSLAVRAPVDRSPFAVAGASTIVIVPDSLPDVPRTMTELLMIGAPGVFVQHSSGAVGAGAWISIRDGAAVRGAEPLIVVDGISMAQAPVGGLTAQERRAPSRLDEIPVEEVERVEIRAGPAAAARYGREARAGVIEITTRPPGQGPPRLHASLTGGSVANDDRFPRNSTRVASSGAVCYYGDPATECASATPSTYTPLLDASPFRTATSRQAVLGVTGGLSALSYAVNLSNDVTAGVLPSDGRDLSTANARLAVAMPATMRLQLTSRAALRGVTTPFEGDESLLAYGLVSAADCSPATPCAGGDSISRGYGGGTPEELARRGVKHRIQHFANGATLLAAPRDWLSLRTLATTDNEGERGGYEYGVRNYTDYSLSAIVQGAHDERAVRNVLGQDIVARHALGNLELVTALAVRADHDRSRSTTSSVTASLVNPFPSVPTAPGPAVSGVTTWYGVTERRRTITLAPRLSGARGSLGVGVTSTRTRFEGFDRFGLRTGATLDGSADGSITMIDRADAPTLRRLVLRAAAGQVSGYETGSPIYLQTGVSNPAGFELMPNANGVVRPDRSYEGEAGGDLALAPASSRLSFTAYRRRETHRGMYGPPSYISGGPTFPVQPLRRVVNGVELSLDATPIARGATRLETNLAFTLQSDRVVSDAPTGTIRYGGALYSSTHSLIVTHGRSFGSWLSSSYSFVDANGNGVVDPGEAIASGVAYGRSRPSRFGSLGTRLAVARRLTLGALLTYQGGNTIVNEIALHRCLSRVCPEWQSPSPDVQLYARQAGSTPYFVSGEALRVRELSLSYAIPGLAHTARAGAVRLTLSARNVATFSHSHDLDPETSLPDPSYSSDAVPWPGIGLPRTLALRLTAAY